MAYIRSKNIRGHTRYQVVETHRAGCWVTHHVLGDLGRHPTVEEAVAALRKKAAQDRQTAETMRQQCLGGYYFEHRAARAEAQADALAELPMS